MLTPCVTSTAEWVKFASKSHQPSSAPRRAAMQAEPCKEASEATCKTRSHLARPAGSPGGIQWLAGKRSVPEQRCALPWVLYDLDVPGPMSSSGVICPSPRLLLSSGLVGCGLLQHRCCEPNRTFKARRRERKSLTAALTSTLGSVQSIRSN